MHIMLDLETWGKKPGCDIRSIGAVVFDPVAGPIAPDWPSHTFYVATENAIIASEIVNGYQNKRMKYPLARDPETVKWWNEQSPEAQAAFANPVDLREACYAFGHWIADSVMSGDGAHTEQPTLKIWANDPHFDVSILDAVYDAVGLPVPWHYRAPRSMKTITDAAGMTRDDYCNYGEAHNALDDAIAQAMTVCEAYKRLGLQRVDQIYRKP